MWVQVFKVRGDGGFGFAERDPERPGVFGAGGDDSEQACQFAARVAAYARDRDPESAVAFVASCSSTDVVAGLAKIAFDSCL